MALKLSKFGALFRCSVQTVNRGALSPFIFFRFAFARCAPAWRMHLAVGVSAETIIANGMAPPITVETFPAVETLQPEGLADQPNVARS